MTTHNITNALVLRNADGSLYLFTAEVIEQARIAAEQARLAEDDTQSFLGWSRQQPVAILAGAELLAWSRGQGLALGQQKGLAEEARGTEGEAVRRLA